jgi:hypothetical protein
MTDTDAAERQRQFAAAQTAVQQALRSPLPRLYINSFVNVLTDADVMLILQCNQQNVGILNMNYTVAKSLVNALSVAIAGYEKRFTTEVPNIEIASVEPQR